MCVYIVYTTYYIYIKNFCVMFKTSSFLRDAFDGVGEFCHHYFPSEPAYLSSRNFCDLYIYIYYGRSSTFYYMYNVYIYIYNMYAHHVCTYIIIMHIIRHYTCITKTVVIWCAALFSRFISSNLFLTISASF